MQNNGANAIFLRRLIEALEIGLQAILTEIKCLKMKQQSYFNDCTKKLLQTPQSLADAYEQLIRDKKVVSRRYDIFLQKCRKFSFDTITDEEVYSLSLEIMNLIDHSQAVIECADEMDAEMQELEKVMLQMNQFLERLSESDSSFFEPSDEDDNDIFDELL